MRQGMWMAHEAGKGKEMDSLEILQEEHSPTNISVLVSTTHFRFLTSNTAR